MELTVTSGFINNPPVSHVCKPRDKKLPSWHKLRNTAHVCDQNGHSRWTPAPFMAFIDVKEQLKKKSTACCLPTRLLNMQSHGWTRRIWGFSRKERRRHPSSQVPPPIWNAGAWPGIPHAGFTQEHGVPSVGHKQPASHC